MKRFLDTLLAIVFAPLWLVALGVCIVLVAIIDGRPIFFRQERAGLNGKPFGMLKLRTMRDGDGTDAERLTRLGKLLRATSLDELPQLLHVISGKMALVGPRPLPVRYLPRYSQEQRRRHEVRPGITGWAQVNGRNAISWQEKFAFDVWYVDHRTLWIDAKILFATLTKVFHRDGINNPAADTMDEFLGEG